MPVEITALVEKPRPPEASERLAATYGMGNHAGAATTQRTEHANAQRPAQADAQRTEHATAQGPERATARGPERTDPQGPEQADAQRTEHATAERQSALARRLQSLGVPADIAFRATSPDMYTALVEAFRALPPAEPAPDGPGETLIVIGESTHAVDVARIVGKSLRLDAGDILFAGRNAAAAGIEGRHRITGAHDARQRAKRLRRSDTPSVVAVEAALDESIWAASIVEAIRPAGVWVVVDVSRKTSDIAHHLQGLRRVDAIALRATMSSGDPASPLALGLPVALLEGRDPTPHAWAAMLCERLSLVGG